MSARLCEHCNLKLPIKPRRVDCPLCGRPVRTKMGTSPSPDWEERIERFEEMVADADPERRRMVAWRLELLMRVGMPWELAPELASRRSENGGFAVNVHQVESLIARGCSAELAARIAG